MLRVYYGEKGTGKSKRVIRECNDRAETAKGSVVFIDDDNSRTSEINNRIRFVNLSEYEINNAMLLRGFIAGLEAQDYDLEAIYMDGFSQIIGSDLSNLAEFFEKLNAFAEKASVDITFSINGKDCDLPTYLTPYVVKV